MRRSGSHDAVIRVYDETGNVIETHEHKGDLKNGNPPATALVLIEAQEGEALSIDN